MAGNWVGVQDGKHYLYYTAFTLFHPHDPEGGIVYHICYPDKHPLCDIYSEYEADLLILHLNCLLQAIRTPMLSK